MEQNSMTMRTAPLKLINYITYFLTNDSILLRIVSKKTVYIIVQWRFLTYDLESREMIEIFENSRTRGDASSLWRKRKKKLYLILVFGEEDIIFSRSSLFFVFLSTFRCHRLFTTCNSSSTRRDGIALTTATLTSLSPCAGRATRLFLHPRTQSCINRGSYNIEALICILVLVFI